MRRKTKGSASSESPEKPAVTRRSTRRGRASPVEEVNASDGESSSESEEYSPKKTRRTAGRRTARSKGSSGSDREAKTSKSRGRKRGASKKLEEPVVEDEDDEEEIQREGQEAEVSESILPDEANDDAEEEQENGGEKVSIEIVPADPEPHVTEDSESGFPQRTSSPEHVELYDDDVHMKTLSPVQPSESVREEGEAQSTPSDGQQEPQEDQERRPETPPVEEEQKESEEEDEKQERASKRSSSPEEGELPDQSVDGGSKGAESPEHNHSKSEHNSEDEEPVKKTTVKEVKAPEVVFVGKLTRNDGKANVDEQGKKKRRWMSKKPSAQSILAISTDSLKPLIADVKPVPLVDVKLDLTSDPEPGQDEEDNESEEEGALSPKDKRDPPTVEKTADPEAVKTSTEVPHPIGLNRKIVLVNDDVKTAKPPTPPKNTSSCILYITNLVRPFTVLQLKGLLARTGKIVENGFWIDKIKSKCYVQYETEE